MRLERKVAVITGGTRGIGLAVSELFAREGATVIMLSVDSDEERQRAEDAVTAASPKGVRACAYTCDVGYPDQVERMIAEIANRHAQIDILVNNAGVGGYADFFEISPEEWQRIVDINYRGVFVCSRAVARIMIDRGTRGRIITTSSLGVFTGSAVQAHYCSTKAAAHNLMQSLALILGPHGITCNSVAPAAIVTAMSRDELADAHRRDAVTQRTAVKRLGAPADVASAYLYFASDEAAFTTGTHIRVDGGILINV